MKSKTKARLLAVLGVITAGWFARHALVESRRRPGGFVDKILRTILFQSKSESVQTESRSAISLAAELISSVYSCFNSHNVMSIAASSGFFIVLAIFPGLAALVALYGLLGDPADISNVIATMPEVIPGDVVRLVQGYLANLTSQPNTNLGPFALALFIAMWSANSAMKSLIEALYVVYERQETRSFLRLNLLASAMTLTFTAFTILAVGVMILPLWNLLIPSLGPEILRLRWLMLLFMGQTLISALYYFAPCGRQKHFHLLTAGATLASIAWVIVSMGFSYYLTYFAHYSITYGPLGTAAVFMTWLWLTVVVLLLGAEVDAGLARLGAKEVNENGETEPLDRVQ